MNILFTKQENFILEKID